MPRNQMKRPLESCSQQTKKAVVTSRYLIIIIYFHVLLSRYYIHIYMHACINSLHAI